MPTVAADEAPDHSPNFEIVRHLVLGSLPAVRATIATLHSRGYAEAGAWSRPLPTGRPNEVMVILTRRLTLT